MNSLGRKVRDYLGCVLPASVRNPLAAADQLIGRLGIDVELRDGGLVGPGHPVGGVGGNLGSVLL